ncbi:M15 family metallopeptidase [Clostridium sp. KNHs205]|uniref:M15 family metallopeptidase n=1 Tax=Clostridium sp. KNHs205 TaxID=1449050 RepID=UPI00051BF2D9|nr:M15 family metallopeptidase [Clostridium sp. KNHs205]
MSNTDQCRDIKELNPLVQVMLNLALEDIKRQGINPLVVETYRPLERQRYLYCQGRTISECTAAGITKTFATAHSAPKASKVTWTLNSIHIQRKAVDVVPQRKVSGKMTAIWDSQDKETKAIISTMLKYGFEPGANWKDNPDSPHFQVKGDFESLFYKGHTTYYVTMAVQIALNKKIGAGLVTDGIWGDKTTAAVNKFRVQNLWIQNGKLGATALKKLLG